jgi:hypothetical protein
MKQYLFIILLLIIFVVFFISFNTIKESNLGNISQLPDTDQIVIDSSESLRDFLGKMRYIANLDEHSIYNNIKPSVCYKINKLYTFFDSVKNFLDNKTEEEIMAAYGPKEQHEIAGQKVGLEPPMPIIGSNYDYYTLILLSTYMKMLKPYNDLNIWSQNDNNNPPSITSSCNYNDNDNDSIQFINCARNMLNDIKNILTYFQYQSDNTNVIAYGDGADTGTGAVPKN